MGSWAQSDKTERGSMNKNILWIILIISSSIQSEIHTCSFLPRYGTNSYITNIPLFFKKNNSYMPQKNNPKRHKTNKSAIIIGEPITKKEKKSAGNINNITT